MDRKQRISYLPLEAMDDEMRAEMERCRREGTPRPESSAVRAHVPACFWAFADGNEPVCSIPLPSIALPVSSIPDWLWSREWLEAVSQTSQPVALIPCASAGGVLKIG